MNKLYSENMVDAAAKLKRLTMCTVLLAN